MDFPFVKISSIDSFEDFHLARFSWPSVHSGLEARITMMHTVRRSKRKMEQKHVGLEDVPFKWDDFCVPCYFSDSIRYARCNVWLGIVSLPCQYEMLPS